jgi:hypothetical protein
MLQAPFLIRLARHLQLKRKNSQDFCDTKKLVLRFLVRGEPFTQVSRYSITSSAPVRNNWIASSTVLPVFFGKRRKDVPLTDDYIRQHLALSVLAPPWRWPPVRFPVAAKSRREKPPETGRQVTIEKSDLQGESTADEGAQQRLLRNSSSVVEKTAFAFIGSTCLKAHVDRVPLTELLLATEPPCRSDFDFDHPAAQASELATQFMVRATTSFSIADKSGLAAPFSSSAAL